MLTCILVEPNTHIRTHLIETISTQFHKHLDILDAVDSIHDAFDAVQIKKPDIVFCASALSDGSVIDFLRQFKPTPFVTVILGEVGHIGLEAMKFGVVDYLETPIQLDELRSTVTRLRSWREQAASKKSALSVPSGEWNNNGSTYHKIALPTASGFELERIDDIAYCEGLDNYARITTADNRQIIVSKTLKFIEGLLPGTMFFRIHKSTLVNMNYVKSYSRVDGYRVTMLNGKKLDVSYRRNEFLVKRILNRIEPSSIEGNPGGMGEPGLDSDHIVQG